MSQAETPTPPAAPPGTRWRGPAADWPFFAAMGALGAGYLILILALLLADSTYIAPDHFLKALSSREIRYAIKLSLLSSTLTALLSIWVATPIGYLMSRLEFRGKALVEALLDIPIALPPLVIGLSLLIFFQTGAGRAIESAFQSVSLALFNKQTGFTYRIPGVILAQFAVSCAFAARTMRGTFDLIGPREERVALTLGCGRAQAFWRVTLPQAARGIQAAFTLAWARALGEFGPVLIFAGATRLRTEVLPTTIFLELSVGHIEAAVAVSLLMVFAAVAALVIVRVAGPRSLTIREM